MDTTIITKQLRREVRTSLTRHSWGKLQSPKIVAHNTWQTKALQSQQLVEYVYDKLQVIIKRNRIAFTSKQEEEGFISAIEPEINNIIIQHIP